MNGWVPCLTLESIENIVEFGSQLAQNYLQANLLKYWGVETVKFQGKFEGKYIKNAH